METNIAPKAMVVTPHHLATQSAIEILKEGGTAIDAMVSAAATISVVYPHMNTIGGDGFWLIIPPQGDPIIIEACGAAGSFTSDFFTGLKDIPNRGPKSATTVAGTVAGWEEALNYISECGYQRMLTSKLLADAIRYAEDGFPMTSSQHKSSKRFQDTENMTYEFSKVFFPDGRIPEVGERFCQKELSNSLKLLAENGLTSYYKGKLAKLIAADMISLGMPITESDLASCSAIRKTPLRLLHSHGELFNTPPPTQGIVSMSILGILDRLIIDGENEGQFIHSIVEATKQAFQLRDKYITDPDYMSVDPNLLLSNQMLHKMAKNISFEQVSANGKGKGPGDTIWMGIMDSKGFSVSFIQSIYHEFGSGLLLPRTGILWQNRGIAFNLEKDHILSIKPGKKPFHTLNPAAARLRDGRLIIYGTRGGDGQSQTQAAIFHRYVIQGIDLQKSISAPRWYYGKDIGDKEDSLKIEGRICEETIRYLKDQGHDIVVMSDYNERMGQAGALVRHPNGMLEGAFDPRSNGSAAGF